MTVSMVQKSDKKKESKDTFNIPADIRRYIAIVRKEGNEDIKRHTDRVRAEANEDLTRYMGALMEENREQIKGISERFVDFDRTLNSHTEMIGDIAEDVAVLRVDVAVLKEDVVVLKDDMVIVKKDISEIKGDLKQKVDRGEFVVLERRVTSVEANV